MVVIGSSGVLSPGKWRWLRSLGWMATLTVLLIIVFNGVAKVSLLLLGGGGEASAGSRLAAAIVGCVAILGAYRLSVGLGERRAVPEIDLRHAPVDLIAGMMVGAAMMVSIIGLLSSFNWVVIERQTVHSVALVLRDSIRSGVVEELLLRLVIFRLLWRALGIWPAIIAAAVLFGALHLANPDSSLFAAACLIAGEGIGIGLYLLTGRIWAPIGMHARLELRAGLGLRRGGFRHHRDFRRPPVPAARAGRARVAERRRIWARGVAGGAGSVA
jgi:hypothetical protein